MSDMDGFTNYEVDLMRQNDQLKKQLTEAQAEKLKIIRGEFGQICGYCGEGNDDGLSWEELQAHIKSCDKHPLSKAEQENKRLLKHIKAILQETKTADWDYHDDIIECRNFIRSQAEQALKEVG